MRFRSKADGVDPGADSVLIRFRAAVDAAYGDRVERVVLFGSRARGDYRADSDYDVAVFLKDWRSLWDELEGMSEAALDILVDTGQVISPKPLAVRELYSATGLMAEIHRDGLEF